MAEIRVSKREFLEFFEAILEELCWRLQSLGCRRWGLNISETQTGPPFRISFCSLLPSVRENSKIIQEILRK